MRGWRKWAVVLGLALALSAPAVGGELEQREQLKERIARLYLREDFAELDRLFDEARTNKTRTDSGVWQLWVLHRGLAEAEPRPATEAIAHAQSARAQRWLAQRPQSVEAGLVVAQAELRYARALGCGECSVVSEDQRIPLQLEAVERARALLQKAKRTSSQDPQWYAEMLEMGQMERWGPALVDQLLDEASARASDYYTIWFEAVDAALQQPPEKAKQRIDEIARRAMAATRATEGASMYARVWWYASQVEYGDELFEVTPLKWEDFDAGIRDVMKRYPDDWNRNSFANFACNAGKKARARELMAGHEPLPPAWDSQELFLDCVGPSFKT